MFTQLYHEVTNVLFTKCVLTEPGADWEWVSTLNYSGSGLPKVNANYTSLSVAFFVPYFYCCSFYL